MSLSPVRSVLEESEAFAAVREWVANARGGESAEIVDAAGSITSFVVSSVLGVADMVWCVCPDSDRAAYLQSDLLQILRDEERVLLFPPTDHRPFDPEHVADPAPVIARADVLQRVADGWRGIVVTGADAVSEKVPSLQTVQDATVSLAIGDRLAPGDLIDRLVERGFLHVEFVEQPGELALRGGILDVFPFVGDYPVRIEFFGDDIDSIREFDIHTQRSVSRRTSARLVPDLDREAGEGGSLTTLAECLPDDSLVVFFDEALVQERLTERYDQAVQDWERYRQADPAIPEASFWYSSPADVTAAFASKRRLLTGTFLGERAERRISLQARPQTSFNSSLAAVRQALITNSRQGIRTSILCDTRGQEARLAELLEDDLVPFSATLSVDSLHRGFEVPSLGIAVYTDHEIFNRYHRPTTRQQKQRFGGISLRELQQLVPGDFVVHIDHGIGRFAGMEEIEVRGRRQEAVRLMYKGSDVLYVNVSALHKLHKYKGQEGHQPGLTKLGSGQWERTKSRTRKHVKDIARDLIRLYAQRKASEGHAFPEDTVWQREFEASFEFEDTPDQGSAADAVKADMQQPVPMDRLVCGDVGFGKTEVAIRAAFKAVQEGRQVAVLVPTTVLASQHLRTFRRRLDRYPVRIEVLSRFRTGKEVKEVLAGVENGTVDIAIGTHRLISADVRFKDLGLLVVDEEQRFGVAVKERLRKLRVNVDTLTLTATPIPRTLQFSLLGARDLSIISTAPPNRQPILTEIHTFDKDLIRDAILHETSRGGQIFFIHNRVQSIQETASMIRNIVPDVRVVVGHGQMKGPELERVMLQFVERKADILVSTSIIENGLDIANANTIIIDRADHFGLAELHQLRGRVGRSDRKAFCYLLVPSIHGLTREARQRLQAVEEFSELGSGFQIAMRDLDIRGAGNMLGAEQSGFITDVGFETYHRILDDAVAELRDQEFADLFPDRAPRPVTEALVEMDSDALIPDSYLANRVERLNMYRKLSGVKTHEELETVRAEMADRFGPYPDSVGDLLRGVAMKLLAERLRLSRVLFKNQRLFLYVPEADADPYFFDTLFQPLLKRMELLEKRFVVKETSGRKLRLIVQDVPDLDSAVALLGMLQLTEDAAAAP